MIQFLPIVLKALFAVEGAPKLSKAVGLSANPAKNPKAIIAALIGLALYHGIPPEWVALLEAAAPYLLAGLSGLYLIGKAPKK